MCGITGFWRAESSTYDVEDALRSMTAAVCHRGPDDEGNWVDRSVGIALGHRRLAVLDPSPDGAQPMSSASDRYVIVFNGEIYNHREIRSELGSHMRLRGHSDTEVMLASIERWGLLGATSRFVGMFAFGLWDKKLRTLSLVRDRVGEKPLYYGWMGNTLLFGSELKALRAHPAWRASIDRGSLTLLLRHNYIPAPYSIYEGVHKVCPATILTFRTGKPGDSPASTVYWSARLTAENGVLSSQRREVRESELVESLDVILRRAVADEMVADVPVGAFLSGGIDSSLIVALMQAQSSRRVKTFTIGFHEKSYNEAQHAKAVARHLGTDHTELYVTASDTLAVVPSLPVLWDEPFSDSSQIPTFLVSRLARQQVTVSLTGDAGDELFGGYNRYIHGARTWRALAPFPTVARRAIAGAIRAVSPDRWDRVLQYGRRVLPGPLRVGSPGDRIHKLASIIEMNSFEEVYRSLISHWQDPSDIVIGGFEPPTALSTSAPRLDGAISRMMYLDLISYLPDDILVKLDRAAMGVSLETRAPFLDHRVIEFAWGLPLSAKIRHGVGKSLLRSLLHRYVPQALVERPKMGFGVPVDAWLRGPLREWAEDLLAEGRLRNGNFFNVAAVREKWRQHQDGSRNWQYLLWDILMFESWRDAQICDGV